MSNLKKLWPIYNGERKVHAEPWPVPPPWRRFGGKVSEGQENWKPRALAPREEKAGSTYIADHKIVDLVNAAIFLARPLLVTGRPGTGKSSLAYSVAYELDLGEVLHWPITSRSTLMEGLYRYDAIGRLHDAQMDVARQGVLPPMREGTAAPAKTPADVSDELRSIGCYIRLGPLGTALVPSPRPRALLIDEIDKSNIDLPNDLLHAFETGEFEIPELTRLGQEATETPVKFQGEAREIVVSGGHIKCSQFPFVVLTSNGERELPPPFLRRCIRLNIEDPDDKELAKIVVSKFKDESGQPTKEDGSLSEEYDGLIRKFIDKRSEELSTDQLLNAIYLRIQGVDLDDVLKPEEKAKQDLEKLIDVVFKPLRGT